MMMGRFSTLAAQIDNPVTFSLLGFFVTVQLLAMHYDCRAWFVVMPNSRAVNQSLMRDFERILESLETNKSTYGTIEPDKNLVFIGVMTAQRHLDNRALMIHSTWGKRVPGKMHFFSGADSTTQYDLPLIALEGVDDSYPPQKKNWMMIKFLHDNYVDKFDWFIRADDDMYIKTDRLEKFLRSLNASEPLFVGQAGQGNAKDFGLLGFDYSDNFCMGGVGVIMSRTALKTLGQNVGVCLNNLQTIHDDVEIGRCLKRLANISCTWNYEVSCLAKC